METGSGLLYVISAPSGAGKTTLVKALVDSVPTITVSVSHTTRPRRPAETEAIDYYFVAEDEFRRMINEHEFLEYATVFNHFYGTSRRWVEQTLAKGMDVILEIDWQGARQIQQLFHDCISIFILPPSRAALSERLLSRNQDSYEIIQQRLSDVREATSHIQEFDYIVMNDDFEKASHDLRVIVEAGQFSQKRQTEKYRKLIADLGHIGEPER